jgi:hypothetical protein
MSLSYCTAQLTAPIPSHIATLILKLRSINPNHPLIIPMFHNMELLQTLRPIVNSRPTIPRIRVTIDKELVEETLGAWREWNM